MRSVSLFAVVVAFLVACSGSASKDDPGPRDGPQDPGSGAGPYTLQVSPTGVGSVSGSGIDCGATCSTVLASGTLAVLNATPGAAASFGGWTGCDQAQGRTCLVSMSANRTVSASFVACTGCSNPRAIGAATVGEIGPAGGTLSSGAGGLTLVVPPGAVAAPTAFSIQPVTNTAPGGRGTAYEVGPSGPLLQPVTLTFSYPQLAALGTAPSFLGVSYREADGGWRRVPVTVDAGARTIQATVDHFTTFGPIAALRLNPAVAVVQPGGVVPLWIDQCAETRLVSPPVSSYRCDDLGPPDLSGYEIVDWSVNGQAGGTSELGVIVATTGPSADGLGMYKAPPTAPSPSAVTVSVRLRDVGSGAMTILVAEVTIAETMALRGTIELSVVPTLPDGSSGSGYNAKLDVRQRSIFLNLEGSTLQVDSYDRVTSVCTYEPKTFPVPLLAAAFEPGDSVTGTYMLGGLYSGIQNTTVETCTDRSTGEVTTRAAPNKQISWSVLNADATSPEFPGSLNEVGSFHSGEWVNPDGQAFSWGFVVVPGWQ